MKIRKKKLFGGGGWGGRGRARGGGGRGRGRRGGGVGLGGHGGCDGRIEVFGKIHPKKISGGGGGEGSGGGVGLVGEVRVDVNEELKFL